MHFPSGTKADPGKKKTAQARAHVNIGPSLQKRRKPPQIQPSFRVKIGSPFVHFTNFHRRSESFFGARLFILAISAPDSSILFKFDPKRTFLKKVAFFENLSLSRPPRTTRLNWPLARNAPGPHQWAKKICQGHMFLSGPLEEQSTYLDKKMWPCGPGK